MKYLNTYNKIFEVTNNSKYATKNLTELPELPDDLEILNCRGNHIKKLPKLPETLKELWCHKNELTSLPDMPGNLTIIACNNNKLTSLPELINLNSLERLHCGNNQLTSIPKLPEGLRRLHCSKNKIIMLPELPESLEVLFCYDNLLECMIPDKFLDSQDNDWMEEYYLPMIESYEGQKKILINNILIFKELGEQLKYFNYEFDPRIIDEFSIMKQDEWG